MRCTGSVHFGIFSIRQQGRACAEIQPEPTSRGHGGAGRCGGHGETGPKLGSLRRRSPRWTDHITRPQGAVAALDATVTVGTAGREGLRGNSAGTNKPRAWWAGRCGGHGETGPKLGSLRRRSPRWTDHITRPQGAVAALDAAVTVGAAEREDMERNAGVATGGLEFLHELGAAIDLHRAHGQALQGLVEEVSGDGGGGVGADLDVDALGSGPWRGIA